MQGHPTPAGLPAPPAAPRLRLSGAARECALDLIGANGVGPGPDEDDWVPTLGSLRCGALMCGGWDDAADVDELARCGVTAVLDLTGSGPAADYSGLADCVSVRIEDDEGCWHDPSGYELLAGGGWHAAQLAEEWLRQGHRVLVHCVEGRNRAPAVCAAICIAAGAEARGVVSALGAARGGVLHNRGFALSLAALSIRTAAAVAATAAAAASLAAAATAASPPQLQLVRQRLLRLLRKHRPALAEHADTLLGRCRGKELQMVAALERTYAVEQQRKSARQVPPRPEPPRPEPPRPEPPRPAGSDAAGAAALAWARALGETAPPAADLLPPPPPPPAAAAAPPEAAADPAFHNAFRRLRLFAVARVRKPGERGRAQDPPAPLQRAASAAGAAAAPEDPYTPDDPARRTAAWASGPGSALAAGLDFPVQSPHFFAQAGGPVDPEQQCSPLTPVDTGWGRGPKGETQRLTAAEREGLYWVSTAVGEAGALRPATNPEIEAVCAELLAASRDPLALVGVDTEWSEGRPQVVQIALGSRGDAACRMCVLLDVARDLPGGVAAAARAAFAGEATVLVFAASGDIAQLVQTGLLSGQPVVLATVSSDAPSGGWVDLQQAAMQAPFRVPPGLWGVPGLRRVAQKILHTDLDKGEQRSDWARRPLSPAQLHYAALDAVVLLRLHAAMLGRVSARA